MAIPFNKQFFIRFLKENNALDAYCQERNGIQNTNSTNFFTRLTIAFPWSKTKQGFRFWANLEKRFDFLQIKMQKIQKRRGGVGEN